MNVKEAWEIARSQWNFRDPASPPGWNVPAPPRLAPIRIGMMTTTMETGRDIFRFSRREITIETAGAKFPAIEITCEGHAWRKIYDK